jgi:hypothetical protein
MVSSRELFHTLELKDLRIVRTSSAEDSLQIQGVGSIRLKNDLDKLELDQVLFVPTMVVNLLSVQCPVLQDYSVDFLKNSF